MNARAFFFESRKVARLRAEAALIDAEFERQERKAEAELRAIQQRNVIDVSERLLHFAPTPAAPALCVECLNATPGPVR